jgi:ArsR family transcriptional regulator
MAKRHSIDFEKYAEIFKALGHPVRLQMVVGLSCNECSVNEIVSRLGLPQSTVSQHLGIMRSRGILTPHKDGVRTCYRVEDELVRRIVEMLEV